jgi:hypothetical protein
VIGLEITDWIRSRPWGECTPCQLKWKGSRALEDAQQHTAETGHATLYAIEDARVISRQTGEVLR